MSGPTGSLPHCLTTGVWHTFTVSLNGCSRRGKEKHSTVITNDRCNKDLERFPPPLLSSSSSIRQLLAGKGTINQIAMKEKELCCVRSDFFFFLPVLHPWLSNVHLSSSSGEEKKKKKNLGNQLTCLFEPSRFLSLNRECLLRHSLFLQPE